MSKDRFPGATWLPLPENDEQGSYTKTQLIFHSTGTKASAEANKRYFARSDVKVESTLIVNYDGSCLQVMPASARADANGAANKRAISVEVVGTADEPFTPEQIETCIAIAKWACAEHPIERRQIPSESESGIGWHVMFGAPGPWTSVRGKQCPGQRRIVQVAHQVIPAVRPAKPAPLPTPAPPPAQEVKMFYVYTGADGLDWGTDLVTRRPFESQSVKSAWIAMVERVSKSKVTRITLSADEAETLPAVGL